MRIRDWDAALMAELRRHAQMPFGYGGSDCFTVCSDCVQAVTGVDPYPKARKYKTEAGAARMLRKHGFENIAEAWAAKFPEVNRLSVMRGDICIAETEFGVAGAIWNGREAFTKGPFGNVLLGLGEIVRVHRVE